jgi:NAD(P)-dependent dehydrogenase (short-subunit alcohol dehydrogenase family)
MTINPMALTDKNILVTGASGGIGRATAIILCALGAKVVIAGRDREKLEKTHSLLPSGQSTIEQFDFSNSEEIVDWMKSLTQRLGTFDGLVHSAGIHYFKPLSSITVKSFERLLRVNTVSCAMLVKAMQLSDVGSQKASIVLISSTAAIKGDPANGLYGASKGAIISLVKAFALELVSRNIRINTVAPALVQTEMADNTRDLLTEDAFQAILNFHPMGIGEPVDVANAIAFLLSDASRWITGICLPVCGGLSAR